MPPRRVDVPLAQLPPDIVALIDMSITAAMGHRLAAGALWNAMADAGQREDGVTEQKILMAKLGAEEVAALEDLGALVYAIGHRADGIIRAYLIYKPMHVRKVYSRIAGGESLIQILLPAIESLNLDRRERHWMRKGAEGLAAVARGCSAQLLGAWRRNCECLQQDQAWFRHRSEGRSDLATCQTAQRMAAAGACPNRSPEGRGG